MKKNMICIVCPKGCEIIVDLEDEVSNVYGFSCDKGYKWAIQELNNPMRIVTSSIKVERGDIPLVSVKTDSPVPLQKVFDVMNDIRAISIVAPVKPGDVIMKNVSGLPCNVISTKEILKIDGE